MANFTWKIMDEILSLCKHYSQNMLVAMYYENLFNFDIHLYVRKCLKLVLQHTRKKE